MSYVLIRVELTSPTEMNLSTWASGRQTSVAGVVFWREADLASTLDANFHIGTNGASSGFVRPGAPVEGTVEWVLGSVCEPPKVLCPPGQEGGGGNGGRYVRSLQEDGAYWFLLMRGSDQPHLAGNVTLRIDADRVEVTHRIMGPSSFYLDEDFEGGPSAGVFSGYSSGRLAVRDEVVQEVQGSLFGLMFAFVGTGVHQMGYEGPSGLFSGSTVYWFTGEPAGAYRYFVDLQASATNPLDFPIRTLLLTADVPLWSEALR